MSSFPPFVGSWNGPWQPRSLSHGVGRQQQEHNVRILGCAFELWSLRRGGGADLPRPVGCVFKTNCDTLMLMYHNLPDVFFKRLWYFRLVMLRNLRFPDRTDFI